METKNKSNQGGPGASKLAAAATRHAAATVHTIPTAATTPAGQLLQARSLAVEPAKPEARRPRRVIGALLGGQRPLRAPPWRETVNQIDPAALKAFTLSAKALSAIRCDPPLWSASISATGTRTRVARVRAEYPN